MENKKTGATIKVMTIVWCLVFAIGFLNQYLHIIYHNSVRKDVFIDSVRTRGIAKHIFEGRSADGFDLFPHSAQYYFYADSNVFYGSTFYSYKGNIGDTIDLLYKKSNAGKNLSSHDFKPEPVGKSVFIVSAEQATFFTLIMFLVQSISSWWKARKAK